MGSSYWGYYWVHYRILAWRVCKDSLLLFDIRHFHSSICKWEVFLCRKHEGRDNCLPSCTSSTTNKCKPFTCACWCLDYYFAQALCQVRTFVASPFLPLLPWCNWLHTRCFCLNEILFISCTGTPRFYPSWFEYDKYYNYNS